MGAFHSTKIPVLNLKIQRENGHYCLHSGYTDRCAFGYCFCEQDAKERYYGQQSRQKERGSSVRPTEMTGPVKVDL